MRACTKCGETKPLEAFPPVRRGEEKLQTWCRDCFAAANARNYRKNHEREKTRLLRQLAERRAEVRRQIVAYLRVHPCVDCGESDIVVLEFDHLADKVADVSAYAGGSRTWARVKAEIEKCEVRCANCHRRKTLDRSRGQTRSTPNPARPASFPRRPIQLSLESALGIRTCRVCGLTKPLSEFPYRSLERQARQSICLLCQREYTNAWYARNRARHKAQTRTRNVEATAVLRIHVRQYLLSHPCVDCGESDIAVLDFDHLRDKREDISTLVQYGVSLRALENEIAKCEVRCANCHRRRTAANAGYYRAVAALARIEPQTP